MRHCIISDENAVISSSALSQASGTFIPKRKIKPTFPQGVKIIWTDGGLSGWDRVELLFRYLAFTYGAVIPKTIKW